MFLIILELYQSSHTSSLTQLPEVRNNKFLARWRNIKTLLLFVVLQCAQKKILQRPKKRGISRSMK